MWIYNGKVFKLHSEIREEIRKLRVSPPRIITEEYLLSKGAKPITPTTPTYDPVTQVATEIAPIQVDGVWTQQWEVRDFTPEELDTRKQRRAMELEAVSNQHFFRLCKHLIDQNGIDPNAPILAPLKEAYLEWKALTGN